MMKGNFGFIHEKLDIKILILFILRRISEPITLQDLAELVMCDKGISYFDFSECVAELVKSEHVTQTGDMYGITQKGVRNGETVENSLPYSIRVKVENSTSRMRASLLRDAMIETKHTKMPDGDCLVTLSLSDGVGEIIKIELLATDAKQARALENGFRKNAETVYNDMIEKILKSK
jgi:hypothetical protein